MTRCGFSNYWHGWAVGLLPIRPVSARKASGGFGGRWSRWRATARRPGSLLGMPPTSPRSPSNHRSEQSAQESSIPASTLRLCMSCEKDHYECAWLFQRSLRAKENVQSAAYLGDAAPSCNGDCRCNHQSSNVMQSRNNFLTCPLALSRHFGREI